MTIRRLATVLVLACVACATSPLGRTQLRLLPADEVSQLGVQAFQEMRQKLPEVESRATQRYVRCVAQAITNQVQDPSVPSQWEVVVFQDESPNAFAVPGGKIGVHSGILTVAENQAQLATVLGHEVAHVVSHHANERVSQQAVASAALSVAGQALSPATVAALGMGAQVGVLLPFSRAQEREADLVGLDLMARAGFDPRESVEFWRNLERAQRGGSVEFLSTHPSGTTRMQDLQARMDHAMQLYRQARAAGRNPDCAR